MVNIQPFENNTKQYEDWFENNRYAYLSEIEAVKMLLPEHGFGIEIGVGSGRFSQPLGIGWGIEPSEKMMQLAKKRSINPVKGIAESLPLRTHSVDFVLLVTTICFLSDVDIAMKEAFRVLKHGGALLIGFVDRESDLGKEYQKNKSQNVFYKEATFFSVKEIRYHCQRAGFNHFVFTQTLFNNLNRITQQETVEPGFGRGAFVVIKGIKQKPNNK